MAFGWSTDSIATRRDAIAVRRDAEASIAAAELEIAKQHDEYVDLMNAIYNAGVRYHKQANGRYAVNIIRQLDPIERPAGDAPFPRSGPGLIPR
jgi:hypothetical protein